MLSDDTIETHWILLAFTKVLIFHIPNSLSCWFSNFAPFVQEGSSHDRGLYARCFEELFDLSNSDATSTSKYNFSVSISELHNEQVLLMSCLSFRFNCFLTFGILYDDPLRNPYLKFLMLGLSNYCRCEICSYILELICRRLAWDHWITL